MLLEHLGHGAPAVVARADVALVDAGGQVLVREFAEERFGVIAIAAVAGRHVRALLGETLADGCANPAGTARHKRDTSTQTRAAADRLQARARGDQVSC